MKKFLKRTLITLTLIVLILVGYVQFTWDKSFDAPLPDISATTDSAMIENGRHLAYGPAHCGTCHVPMDKIEATEAGEEIPLSGGWELAIPPGTFRAPNLTPDMETGIGNISDAEIARALRYSVSHNEKFLGPFMPFQNMSDYDVASIISFLRQQEPVKHEVKPTEYTFLGKALMAFGALIPKGPNGTPPEQVTKEATVSYGEYLARDVANCLFCHSEADMKTGKLIGPEFAGGGMLGPDDFTQGRIFISPNLTPDKETGIMASWTEDQFIQRFGNGRIHEGSPMPWGAFTKMDEVELKAIYRYLQSLDPVDNKIEKIIYEKGEEVPN